jgi:hypothetical protein
MYVCDTLHLTSWRWRKVSGVGRGKGGDVLTYTHTETHTRMRACVRLGWGRIGVLWRSCVPLSCEPEQLLLGEGWGR